MSADNSLDTATRHDQHGQWPQAETVDDFRHNLATVHARIAAACERAGRDPASVRLLPVSKTKPEAVLRLWLLSFQYRAGDLPFAVQRL